MVQQKLSLVFFRRPIAIAIAIAIAQALTLIPSPGPSPSPDPALTRHPAQARLRQALSDGAVEARQAALELLSCLHRRGWPLQVVSSKPKERVAEGGAPSGEEDEAATAMTSRLLELMVAIEAAPLSPTCRAGAPTHGSHARVHARVYMLTRRALLPCALLSCCSPH